MQCERMLFCISFVWVFVVFVCHSGLTQPIDHVLVPVEFPKDNITVKIYDVTDPERSETPPHVFPENDSNYKVIKNITILKDLMSHAVIKDQNQTKIDTEVPDLSEPVLNHEVSSSNLTSSSQASAVSSVPTTETKQSLDEKSTTERDLEMDQEEIESDVSKTEDVKLNVSVPTGQRSAIAAHQDHGHPVRGTGPVVQGQLAAVLAGVFALIAVASYVGLLTWRRYLEHRYGNRELLINEEDHVNYNDMKNFEL